MGRNGFLATVCVGLVLVGAPSVARASGYRAWSVPLHLTVGDQTFDWSVSGLRQYVDSTKATNPELFGRLDREVAELESKQTTGVAVMVAGLAAGAAVTIYGFASQRTCPMMPDAGDPNFAADADAWFNCGKDNNQRTMVFATAGAALLAAGLVTGIAILPSRGDMLSIVNRNNAGGGPTMHIDVGYDPMRQYAFGGATFRF